jgi:hypothetical protein
MAVRGHNALALSVARSVLNTPNFSLISHIDTTQNDWKRHESTQHEVRDLWKCCESGTGASNLCGRAFYRQNLFETHLAQEHGYGVEVACIKAGLSMISRNNHSQFWCGFCVKLLRMDERGVLIHNERFTHVSDHFIKGGLSIKDWVDVEEHRTKREILADMDARSPDEAEDGQGEESVPRERRGQTDGIVQQQATSSSAAKTGKKRASEGDAVEQSGSKKQKGSQPDAAFWQCVSQLSSTRSTFTEYRANCYP